MECMIMQLGRNPEELVAKLNLDRWNRDTVIGRIAIERMTSKKHEEVSV